MVVLGGCICVGGGETVLRLLLIFITAARAAAGLPGHEPGGANRSVGVLIVSAGVPAGLTCPIEFNDGELASLHGGGFSVADSMGAGGDRFLRLRDGDGRGGGRLRSGLLFVPLWVVRLGRVHDGQRAGFSRGGDWLDEGDPWAGVLRCGGDRRDGGATT